MKFIKLKDHPIYQDDQKFWEATKHLVGKTIADISATEACDTYALDFTDGTSSLSDLNAELGLCPPGNFFDANS